MASNSLLSDEAHSFDHDFMEGIPIEEEEDQQLSWRLDPVESHSDWTIVIQHASTEKSDTYHVHKNILAVGPCRSDYFASLFRSTHLAESQTNTSHIILEDPAAKSMPMLLDFMYDPNHKLDITTKHVVALRYLAKYFGIRILYRKVMEYHKNDMTLDNIGTYIADAVVFHDETTLSLAAHKCIDNLQAMDQHLLEQMDPTFFLRILSNPEVDTCSVSYHLSILLAKYCQIHHYELTPELFHQLTDRKYIPQIDREAAVPLLEMEAVICGRERNGATISQSTSCLQKRCIKVLALHWKDFADNDSMPTSTFHKLPSSVLVELLEKTLLVAKQNVHDVERSKITDSVTLMDQVDTMKRQKAQAQAAHELELQQCRQEGRDKVNHLRSLLAEKDRQILEYRREWDKMVRVPPDYPRFFTGDRMSTYHHLSGNEPFDNPTNRVNHYGRMRPTAMPRIGESSEDGYLFLETESIPHKRWPVFYYKDG